MMLQYDLTRFKTRKVVFEDVIAARDSVTLEHLKELSSKRRVIEESINQTSSITEAIAREISGGLTSRYEQEQQRLEQYIPLLENLISHSDSFNGNSKMVHWISQLKIRWSSALSSSPFFPLMGLKLFEINNLRFEHCMVLFLYGSVLWQKAFELLQSDLKQSAFTFREAAGVFHYLAYEVLPLLQPITSVEKLPEVIPSVSAAMSLISLAQAQAVYIRKAEESGSTGLSVLAKLHQGIAEFLSEASDNLCLASGECKGISPKFLEFVSSCKALHELHSQKYTAKVLKNDSQIGVAIGLLRNSLVDVERKLPREDSWKVVLVKEIDNTRNMVRKFEHENEFVWHEKVASGDQLPLLQGNRIVNPEPYKPQKWERQLGFKL